MGIEEEDERLGLVSGGSSFMRRNEIRVKYEIHQKQSFIHVAIIVSKSKGKKQKRTQSLY